MIIPLLCLIKEKSFLVQKSFSKHKNHHFFHGDPVPKYEENFEKMFFTPSETIGLKMWENVGKFWKKLKKFEKWPKNHYLATLESYLQFHDFLSFSKKITEKILTAGFYNWWYQYIRKFKYFPNNIPKNISGGGKTVKKFENPLFFYFFFGFF